MGPGPMEGLLSCSPDQIASGSQPLLNPQYLRVLIGCSDHRILGSVFGLGFTITYFTVKLGCRIASFRSWWDPYSL